MDLRKTLGDRDRLARTILAGALTIVAANSLRKGKRLSGVLAGLGALAVGYDATTRSGGLAETVGVDTRDEDAELRCAVCGQPIVPGQERGPNANNEIVHEACKAPAE